MGSWEVDESSGFLTNFRGKVTDSYAATDPRYNEGKTTLVTWEVEIEEVLQEWEGELPENPTVTFPTPPGWSSEDGKLLEHERGKEKFHLSSIYGKIVANVIGRLENYGPNASRTDGEDLVVDLTPVMAMIEDRGTPDDASIWQGLTFEFAEIHFDFGEDRKKKDGSRIESNRTMPIAVVVEDAPAKATKATKSAKKATGAAKKSAAKPAAKSAVEIAKEKREAAKAAAATAESATSDEEADANDAVNPFAELVADEALAEQLAQVLAESDSFDAFVNAVAEIEEVVTSDDGLFDALIDEANGPWAVKAGG